MNFGAHLPIICLATLPEDYQAMAAVPRHATNRKPARARTALLPIEDRSSGTGTCYWRDGMSYRLGIGGSAGRRIPCGSARPKDSRGIVQQIGKPCLRRRDLNEIGRDQKNIVRIIGWFRLQDGMHWRSYWSNVTRKRGGRWIYAGSTTLAQPHTPARFDQSKAIRWRVWGR